MKTGATKPEWDTPPHGDFASYVERLTAMPPQRKAPPTTSTPKSTAAPVSARGASGLKQAPAAAVSSPLAPSALPPDLAQVLLPLVGVFRLVRTVLLVLTVLHGVALFFFGQGSLAGLFFMAALWWGLGWLIQATPQALGSKAAGLPGRAESLQERLRQVAQQRNTGKNPQ